MSHGDITAVSATELDEPCSPCGAYERMRSGAYPWMLESALVREDVGRYSLVGCDPYAVVRVQSGQCELERIREVRGLDAAPEGGGDAFSWLRSLLPRVPSNVPEAVAGLPFLGGAVGYLGYELGSKGRGDASDGLPLPDLVFLLVDAALVFDHVLRKVWSVGLGFADSRDQAELRAARASATLAARAAHLDVEARGDAGAHAWRADLCRALERHVHHLQHQLCRRAAGRRLPGGLSAAPSGSRPRESRSTAPDAQAAPQPGPAPL